MRLSAFASVLLACLCTGQALAATIRVPADQPNLRAAVGQAAEGDTVLIADGIYTGPENRGVIVANRVVRSESLDPATCVVDCEFQDRGFVLGGEAALLEGITVRNGVAPEGDEPLERARGGAILMTTRPTIRACRFENNVASDLGGAIYTTLGGGAIEECSFVGNAANLGTAVYQSDGFLTLSGCVFRNNFGTGGASPAVECWAAASISVLGCEFVENDVGIHKSSDGSFRLESSVFVRNALAVFTDRGPSISNCLFVENDLALVPPTGGQVVANSTFAFNREVLACVLGSAVFECSNIFGNDDGDWVECLADQATLRGNFSADPLFCDPARGDYTLQADSPCRAEATGCGLVGAFDVGCQSVSIDETSWGNIKAKYGVGSGK